MLYPRFVCAGERALVIYLDDHSSPELTGALQHLSSAIRAVFGDAVVDQIPAYTSLLVLFNPDALTHDDIERAARSCIDALPTAAPEPGTLHEISAFYHPDSGADLARLAQEWQMDWREVAEAHHALEYCVYAVGFAPGFAYLGDIDPRISAPRLASPRKRVPAGSIAIAERQTAVYPAASPGGWNLIGKSPQTLFDPHASEGPRFKVGDRVRFVAIGREEFLDAGGEL